MATCERVEVRLRKRDTLAFHDAIREDEDKGNNDALFFSLDYELPRADEVRELRKRLRGRRVPAHTSRRAALLFEEANPLLAGLVEDNVTEAMRYKIWLNWRTT